LVAKVAPFLRIAILIVESVVPVFTTLIVDTTASVTAGTVYRSPDVLAGASCPQTLYVVGIKIDLQSL